MTAALPRAIVRAVARYRVTVDVAAPPDRVFALWTDLDRMREWVGGVTTVTDLTGPVDRAGTSYVVHFGPMTSPTEVVEADPPRVFRTRFGNLILRGESAASFEPLDGGRRTRVVQDFATVGRISAISAWLFSRGNYGGSFQGELEAFATIAEREAADGRAERGP